MTSIEMSKVAEPFIQRRAIRHLERVELLSLVEELEVHISQLIQQQL